MANPWFRLYAEFADDPKVQMMPEHFQRRLIMLFCDRSKGPIDESLLAFHWRIGSVELQETKIAFLEKGFIDQDWNVLNWEKRQYVSDSSASRTKSYRERLNHKNDVPPKKYVTACDGHSDGHSDAPRTDTEQNRTETTEPKGSPPAPQVRPEDFANAWNSHRGMLPKLREFTESRRRKVQARMRQGITVERFSEAVRLCTSMPFLLGNNPRGWVASFDWLIENDRNLVKVLEGNYKKSGVFRGTNQYSSPTLERAERSNSAIADARKTLRRNLGIDGPDEEQLPIAGDSSGNGGTLDGVVAQAGHGTRDG